MIPPRVRVPSAFGAAGEAGSSTRSGIGGRDVQPDGIGTVGGSADTHYMSKPARASYRCTECGATPAKWMGRCSECQAWGTVEEAAAESTRSVGLKSTLKAGTVTTSARRIRDIDATKAKHTTTGIGEFDRVLGGGYIRGGAILIAGEPGVGKSTLLLDAANRYAKTGKTVLYATGEESAEQIKHRAVRMSVDADDLFIASETDLSVILGHIEEVDPDLIIVDSAKP